MKYFSLLFSRISQYWQSGKVVFILFLVGSLIVNVTYVFQYGMMITLVNTRYDDGIYYRLYQSNQGLDDVNKTVLVGLQDNLDDWNIQNVSLYKQSYEESEKRNVSVMTTLSGTIEHEYDPVWGRIYFTEEEIQQKKNVVIVNSGIYTGQTSIHFFEKEYQIIGVYQLASPSPVIVVPCDSWLEFPADYVNMDILTDHKLNAQEEAVFFARLDSIGLSSNDFWRPSSTRFAEQAVQEQLWESLIIQAIVLSGSLFFLHYLAVCNRRTDTICALVGASRSTLFVLSILEKVVLTAISIGGSILIYILLYQPVFQKLYPCKIIYNAQDYLSMSLIMLCASLFVSIPFALWDARKAPIVALRQSL